MKLELPREWWTIRLLDRIKHAGMATAEMAIISSVATVALLPLVAWLDLVRLLLEGLRGLHGGDEDLDVVECPGGGHTVELHPMPVQCPHCGLVSTRRPHSHCPFCGEKTAYFVCSLCGHAVPEPKWRWWR
jgi:hypothetical protein